MQYPIDVLPEENRKSVTMKFVLYSRKHKDIRLAVTHLGHVEKLQPEESADINEWKI